ncbi:MAG: prepilin-type N-terminal cleavage/methylation domain-containing protein [Candidatus Peribacteraceae bacterium]|nr:prepilin-type N-terminal cleavage/methylation domain-containing protein [Candidatus Peribacteraceae bacterium]
MRRGFTLVELVTIISIAGALAGISFPLLRLAFIRSNLSTAAEQASSQLRRARILAQSGERGPWGVHTPTGTLYQGSSFEERDESLDELLPILGGIQVSGLEDISFSALFGLPSGTGSIFFIASTGDMLQIEVKDESFGPPKIVSDISDVFVKVTFLRIKNTKEGNAQPTVHVGQEGTTYEEGEWIPLTKNGDMIIDNGFSLAGDGIAMERGDGFMRIFAYGGIPLFQGMEIVDARITLKEAEVISMENDEHPNRTEFPFDGYVFDWPIGDEITKESNTEVLFQTRVTNESDSFILNWRAMKYGWR